MVSALNQIQYILNLSPEPAYCPAINRECDILISLFGGPLVHRDFARKQWTTGDA